MTDRNAIKAGSYQLVSDHWDHVTSKPGEPFDYTRYYQGDVVTLDVEDARRLVLTGAVVEPGSLQRAQAAAMQAQWDAFLATVPADMRAEFERTQQEAHDAGAAEVHKANGTTPRPPQAAVKEQWVEYAVSQGLSADQANAMTKEQLVAAFPAS